MCPLSHQDWYVFLSLGGQRIAQRIIRHGRHAPATIRLQRLDNVLVEAESDATLRRTNIIAGLPDVAAPPSHARSPSNVNSVLTGIT